MVEYLLDALQNYYSELRYQRQNFNINNRIQYWKIRKKLAKNREKTFFSKLKLYQKNQLLFYFSVKEA